MSQSYVTANSYKLEDIQRWIDWLRAHTRKSTHGVLNAWQDKTDHFMIRLHDDSITDDINTFHTFVEKEHKDWSTKKTK